MARAIEQIMAGNYPISPMLARCLFKLAGQGAAGDSSDLPRLSTKETELLALIAVGNSYARKRQSGWA